MRFCGVALTAISLASLACAPPSRPPETAATTLHAETVRLGLDPTVAGAHFVPIDVSEDTSLGVEPGGGARSIAAGVRVVALPGGGVMAARDRLPGAHWDVVALPERVGGGFLFKIEERSVWRAEKWLAPARPIYSSSVPITRIVPGLDRVYVLAKGWRAIDGTTGEPKPLGPWPASPTIGGYAAADGWRALAIADLRGPVATSDAGATWRTLALPIEPHDVGIRGDALEIRGTEGRSDVYYELRADGQVERVPEPTHAPDGSSGSEGRRGQRPNDPAAEASGVQPIGLLGAHPLVAAVDDGWPLGDGTALVARDGALSRVRLEDGSIAESAPGAFPLRPSRCHPVPLGAPGKIGFVCGEPRGATVIYSFDSTHGAMTEVRRFDAPRAVLASGNGAIVVRGPCDARAPGSADAEAHHYCVRTKEGAWSEIRVEGAIGEERVTALADGRLTIVSPPKGNLDTARVTIIDKGRITSSAVVFSDVSADDARILGVGVWLDGIEERRPGVLGGWIEASGTMLGFELSLDGKASLGEFVQGDKSLPMVSGRYGLGWSVASGGYETIDGGMTWTPIVVPQPIRSSGPIASRACGPVGCSAAGWLRIGWGSAQGEPPPAPPRSPPSAPRNHISLPLECDAAELRVHREAAHKETAEDVFGALPASASPSDTRVFTSDTFDTLDRGARTGTVARIYAWGPKSSDWEHGTKWIVRWDWPYGGASDLRASSPVPAPPPMLDAARALSGGIFSWSIALGDDPSHALLVTRRSPRGEGAVFELEADRAPVEIRRANGEPLGELDAAVHAAGRWYVATPPPAQAAAQGGRLEAIVWQIDGPVARELARIPRIPGPEGRALSPARLALRTDGRALGYVVDGQPLSERAEATRWVAAIDLDTGAVGDIELLGSIDFADRTVISALHER